MRAKLRPVPHAFRKPLRRQYPCEKYQQIDEYDSFITHRRQKADLEKAMSIGIEQYNLEQQEKTQILSYLLSNYNDGRRKSFFCVAVNLLIFQT